MRLHNSRTGFTLIEISVVMAIMITLSVLAVTSLSGRKSRGDLTSQTSQIAAVLHEAQSSAMADEDNNTWGVHFDNTGAVGWFATFQGSSYATSSVTSHYELPADVCYANISSGSASDIVFSKTSGALTTSTAQQIELAVGSDCGGTGASSGSSTPSVQSWTATNNTPLYLGGMLGGGFATTYNGYLYFTPDQNGSGVYYAAMNSNGTLGSWAQANSIPTSNIGGEGFVAGNGYLYSIGGGYNMYNGTATVNYAPINGGGSLGTWATTTQLPYVPNPPTSLTNDVTALVYNGYLYNFGDGDDCTNAIVFATINGNGTVGSWTTAASLPSVGSCSSYSVAAYNGYAYIYFDGSDIYYAQINSNGTIGSWTKSSVSMPTNPETGNIFFANNGYLYSITGSGAGNGSTYTYYAKIGTGGSIGSWSTGTRYPVAADGGASGVANGYIYAITGFSNNRYQSSTYAGFIGTASSGTIPADATISISPQGLISY